MGTHLPIMIIIAFIVLLLGSSVKGMWITRDSWSREQVSNVNKAISNPPPRRGCVGKVWFNAYTIIKNPGVLLMAYFFTNNIIEKKLCQNKSQNQKFSFF